MIYHITHNDLDGVACSVLMREVMKKKPQDYKVEFISYRQAKSFMDLQSFLQNAKEGDTVLVTDLSLAQTDGGVFMQVSSYLARRGIYLLYFDHHKDSCEFTPPSSPLVGEYHADMSRSATKMVYDYFLSPVDANSSKRALKIADFVDAVNAFDLWQQDSVHYNRGKSLNTLLSYFGIDEFINRGYLTKYTAQDANIVKFEENRKRSLFERQHLQIIKDDFYYRIGVAFLNEYTSEFAQYVLDKYDNTLDAVQIIDMTNLKISFRSRVGSDVDVSQIAKRLGGGGHKHAAGVSLTKGVTEFTREAIESWQESFVNSSLRV